MVNLCILGPPGSGKGFYGKPLSQYLGFTMFTVSSILRNHRRLPADTTMTPNTTQDLMDSGRLVDCQYVCNVLQDFLLQQYQKRDYSLNQKMPQYDLPKAQARSSDQRSLSAPSSTTTKESTKSEMIDQGVLLDGFPRTLLQIELMQQQWPIEIQIKTACFIHVPDSVCQAKLLGRRVCSYCHRSWNVADVHWDGFDLPALLPTINEDKDSECLHQFGKVCQPTSSWWTRRNDDADPKIVQQRLRVHREHEEPILNHYRQHGRLFSYEPKQGIYDIPNMQQSLQRWLEQIP